jgi:hypothetical protein
MWRWVVTGVLVTAAAAAASSARPFSRSATTFSRCLDVVAGAQPTTAPDGNIVYAYGDQIRSVRPDGTHDRTLLLADDDVSYPRVSRDGRLIAFQHGTTSPEIWLMNSDGSGAHFVTTGTTPDFAPDGAHLAIGGAATAQYRVTLDVVGIDGSGRRTLAVDARPSPEPAWSPDGTKIVFDRPIVQTADPALGIVDADGTNETGFAYLGESGSWSRDGSAVAYDVVDLEGNRQLYAKSPGGTYDRPVGPHGGVFGSISPTWSREGRKLTFVLAARDDSGYGPSDGELWQIDRTGRGRHPLAADCRFGTGSADRIRGTPRPDAIYGLEGNDRIDVRGGRRDFVNCGPGYDVVRADRRDVVARNCERRRVAATR